MAEASGRRGRHATVTKFYAAILTIISTKILKYGRPESLKKNTQKVANNQSINKGYDIDGGAQLLVVQIDSDALPASN